MNVSKKILLSLIAVAAIIILVFPPLFTAESSINNEDNPGNDLTVDQYQKDTLLNRSITLSKSERYQEALYNIEQYLLLEPLAASQWITKGQLLLQLDQPTEALKAFNQGITLESKVGHYYFERALCFEQLSMRIGAQDDINKGLSLGYTDSLDIAERILRNWK